MLWPSIQSLVSARRMRVHLCRYLDVRSRECDEQKKFFECSARALIFVLSSRVWDRSAANELTDKATELDLVSDFALRCKMKNENRSTHARVVLLCVRMRQNVYTKKINQ